MIQPPSMHVQNVPESTNLLKDIELFLAIQHHSQNNNDDYWMPYANNIFQKYLQYLCPWAPASNHPSWMRHSEYFNPLTTTTSERSLRKNEWLYKYYKKWGPNRIIRSLNYEAMKIEQESVYPAIWSVASQRHDDWYYIIREESVLPEWLGDPIARFLTCTCPDFRRNNPTWDPYNDSSLKALVDHSSDQVNEEYKPCKHCLAVHHFKNKKLVRTKEGTVDLSEILKRKDGVIKDYIHDEQWLQITEEEAREFEDLDVYDPSFFEDLTAPLGFYDEEEEETLDVPQLYDRRTGVKRKREEEGSVDENEPPLKRQRILPIPLLPEFPPPSFKTTKRKRTEELWDEDQRPAKRRRLNMNDVIDNIVFDITPPIEEEEEDSLPPFREPSFQRRPISEENEEFPFLPTLPPQDDELEEERLLE
jgi:hypothetical protein